MIRQGDTVMVKSGRERGKTGKVLKVIPEVQRAVVEKLNLVKRHTRPNQKERQGGIIEKETSIHWSNLMLYCEKCKKAVRIRHKIDKKKKLRVCCKCGEAVGCA